MNLRMCNAIMRGHIVCNKCYVYYSHIKKRKECSCCKNTDNVAVNVSSFKESNQGSSDNYPVDETVTASQEKVCM